MDGGKRYLCVTGTIMGHCGWWERVPAVAGTRPQRVTVDFGKRVPAVIGTTEDDCRLWEKGSCCCWDH